MLHGWYAPALDANVRLDQKCLKGLNALAYCAGASMLKRNKFYNFFVGNNY
jgi:hypothetical protein